MKYLYIIIIQLAFAIPVFAQQIWHSDPHHSKLAFITTHLRISDVKVFFDQFQVRVTASKADFSDALIEMTANVYSIHTSVSARDQQLMSEEFFNVARYPVMKYRSTSLIRTGRNTYKLSGLLELHGVKEYLPLYMTYLGTVKDSSRNNISVAAIKITGELNRFDFKIGNNYSRYFISREVRINADGEFLKDEPVK
jgi:polyisoprenoid-binding protein YceI